MTPDKKNAPDADHATGAREQVPNQSSTKKSTAPTAADNQPKPEVTPISKTDQIAAEYNSRFAFALLALIIDRHAPGLHDDENDRTLDVWNLTLSDVQSIVNKFDLPEQDLWQLVNYR